MFTINFSISSPDSAGYSQIIATITSQKKKDYIFYTTLRIIKNDWNIEKQRPKNIYTKKHKLIYSFLNKIKIEVSALLHEYHTKKEKICTQKLKECIKKCTAIKYIHSIKKNSFLYFVNLYIESRTHLITHSTYKRYMVFLRMFRVFEGYSKKYFNVSDINIRFVNNFLLFGKMEQYSPSTLRRTINFIKTILNFIERRGIRTAVYEIALPKEIKDENSITLSVEELNKIKNTVVDDNLQTAKQWLLISCYTGQRISDFMNFSQSQITSIEGNKCLTFVQQKTGKKITLPLHKEVLDILKAIDGFPKKMNFQEYNRKIKNIVKEAGICEKVLISKREGFRKKTAQFFKYETVSSHIGRRSFATNFYGRIPTPLLMEATGHSSEKMFLKYIHVADKQKILLLNKYFNDLV